MTTAVRPALLTNEDQLAALFRGRRESLGHSADWLTDRIGMPDGYVSKIEAPGRKYGRGVITPTFLDWAQALDLAVVVMDRAQAERLAAESEHPPLPEAATVPSPGRQRRREVVRQTTARTVLVFAR